MQFHPEETQLLCANIYSGEQLSAAGNCIVRAAWTFPDTPGGLPVSAFQAALALEGVRLCASKRRAWHLVWPFDSRDMPGVVLRGWRPFLQAPQHFSGAQLRRWRSLRAFRGMKSNVLLHMPTAAELPVSALLDLGITSRCSLRPFGAGPW